MVDLLYISDRNEPIEALHRFHESFDIMTIKIDKEVPIITGAIDNVVLHLVSRNNRKRWQQFAEALPDNIPRKNIAIAENGVYHEVMTERRNLGYLAIEWDYVPQYIEQLSKSDQS